MRNNKMRPANSFSKAEIDALVALHHRLLSGGDYRQLATSKPIVALMRKFHDMAKLAAAAAIAVEVEDAAVGRS